MTAFRIWMTRRLLLQIAGVSPALMALVSETAIAEEGADDVDTSQPNSELIWSSEWDQQNSVYVNSEFYREPERLNEKLGSDYRPPGSSLLQLDPVQQSATKTPQSPPDATAVSAGNYFSDNSNRTFFSDSATFLSSATDKLAGIAEYHLFQRPVELPGNESIGANLQKLDSHSNYFSALVDAVQSMRNSGEWNYKRTYGPGGKDAGDFNYGVVARHLGVPEDVALRFAGWYATHHGTHLEEWADWYDLSGNYGHDPHAQEKIREAYEYYDHRELIDSIYSTPPVSRYHLVPESELQLAPK